MDDAADDVKDNNDEGIIFCFIHSIPKAEVYPGWD